jgi:DNA-binding phage protein
MLSLERVKRCGFVLNKDDVMTGQKRTPWSERAKTIKDKYPDSVTLDWHAVFSDDPAILGSIVNDIMKLDQSRSGKPGKRPSLTESSTAEKLKKIQEGDFSNDGFLSAFRELCGSRSVRAVASKTGLDKSYVHRLMNGAARPSLETISVIAKSFDKHPSYFLEHRVGYILGVLEMKMTSYPESSIIVYNRISGSAEKA